MLGGRAAEEIVYGTKTTGAENDIEQATAPGAQHGHALGHERRGSGMVQLAPRENPYLGGAGGYGGAKPFSEETAEADRRRGAADHQREPRGGQASAERSTAQQLDALAEALLARETLDEQEILEVTGLPPAPALETGMLPVPGAGSGNVGIA